MRSIEEVVGFNKDIVKCCKDLDEDLLIIPLDSNDTIDNDFLHDWSIKDRDHHLDSKKKLGFIKDDFIGQFCLLRSLFASKNCQMTKTLRIFII